MQVLARKWLLFLGNNYTRALQWAQDKEDKQEISRAGVVGTLLQLGQLL